MSREMPVRLPPLQGAIYSRICIAESDECPEADSFLEEYERWVENWYWEENLDNECNVLSLSASHITNNETISTYAETSTDQSNATVLNDHLERETISDYMIRGDPLEGRIDVVSRLNDVDTVHVSPYILDVRCLSILDFIYCPRSF